MRPRLLPLYLAVLIPCTSRAQGLANGGFEAWSTTVLYERLQEWRTGGSDPAGLDNTTRVPGASGTHAAHLETVTVGADTAFGYALLGNIDGNDDPVGGVPFTTAIDAIEGFYRCDLQPGDSAVVLVGVWSFGVLAVLDLHTIGGAQPAWTAFDLPVNQGVPIAPDSVIVAFASSNPFAPAAAVPGSWIEVDAVRLTSTITPVPDQLPNHEFELWDPVTSEDPDGWNTYNSALAPMQLSAVTPATPAHGGALCARITTLATGTDTLPGILTNGRLSANGVSGGEAFSDMPTTMNLWVRYEPAGQDTANLLAMFFKYGLPVGLGYTEVYGTVSNWTLVSVATNIFMTPDTVLFAFQAGSLPGSVLHVDDLELAGGNVGLAPARASAMRVYPVPASDELVVEPAVGATLAAWVLRDALGRPLAQGAFPQHDRGVIDLRGVAPGPLLLELTMTDGTRRTEHVVKR